MKFTAILFAAGVAVASARSGAYPAPHGSPAPMDPPAPGADHHAPSPEYYYESPFSSSSTAATTGPTTTAGGKNDIPANCQLAFQNTCGSLTTGKACAACVADNAMTYTARGCDTLQMIQKLCPTARRSLRLAALPSPFPSPSPMDPPAPSDDHVRNAPAPEFYYDSLQWSPSPLPDAGNTPANVRACEASPAGVKCSYASDSGATVSGTCTLNGSVLECTTTPDKPVDPTGSSCDDVFSDACGSAPDTKTCGQCVMNNRDELVAANCGDLMKLITASC